MKNKLSVSQLNNYIKGVFEDELVLQNISVYGEVFDFSVSGGNTFLVLKEGDCLMRCIKYSVIEKIEIGTQVVLFGSVNFYRKAASVSFVFKSLQMTGEGEIRAKFLETKAKLEKEGLFINKFTLPSFITKVGIITSSTGAVIHDFLSVLSQNHSYVSVEVIQSRVQGVEAENELCNAIVNASTRNFDILVLARGGGSSQDLDCFNSERVARTLASINVPTISAIGHETDYTLCDLVCTKRAGTPSIASSIIVDINEKMISKFVRLKEQIETIVNNKISSSAIALKLLHSKVETKVSELSESFRNRVRYTLNKCDSVCLRKFLKSKLRVQQIVGGVNLKQKTRLIELEKRLDLTLNLIELKNPIKLLKSGYAKVYKDGNTIVGAHDLFVGDKVDILFADGIAKAEILEKKL